MMTLKRKSLIICAAACMTASLLGGCGKKEETTDTAATEQETVSVTESSMIDSDTDKIATKSDSNVPVNDLNGSPTDQAGTEKRYVAVMINNLKDAMPQSGIARADVIYEMLVEGGITRLMALYSDYSDLDKIGPVRSARHYFDRKALEFDAIYVHAGQSYIAEDDIKRLGVNDINGLTMEGFYRDNSRVAPHNLYTSTKGIDQEIEKNGYSTKKDSSYKRSFAFNAQDTVPQGNTASKITTAFNAGRKPWFEYDANTRTYKRFQYGEPQIDDQTGEQLAFKNVIIQFADHEPIPHEDKLININLTASGDGYYASDGSVIPITWTKSSDSSVTRYYTMDGKELKMNPGKTWITLFPDNNKEGITIE